MKDYKLEIRNIMLDKTQEALDLLKTIAPDNDDYGAITMNMLNSYQTAVDYNKQIENEKIEMENENE